MESEHIKTTVLVGLFGIGKRRTTAFIFIRTAVGVLQKIIPFKSQIHQDQWIDFFKQQHEKNDLALSVWHLCLN